VAELRIEVRPFVAGDRDALVRFRADLWPDDSASAHEAEVDAIVRGEVRSTLPLAVLIARCGGAPVGFVEVGLRSHADGCEGDHAVGFLEGWYVAPAFRQQGVGRALVAAAEAWARGHGCREMASDTWSDARGDASVDAHRALGFEVVDRVVTFRKSIDEPPRRGSVD
jgi:aminoglycoside 6'-N-acetyltransferase I